MTYLVDANVLSEATKPAPKASVVDWIRANEQDFVVDSVVIGEMLMGILALPAGRKRRQLEQWFASVVDMIDCLAWDSKIAKRWAKLVADLRAKGRAVPVLDSMVAATALTHNLVVATRNIRDFQKTSVRVVNPFD